MRDEPASGRRTPEALDSRGLAGKRDYVRSLEQRTDPESATLLVECLGSDSSYLRELAVSALLRRGEAVAPAVVPLLGQGLWFTRASAARVLANVGPASVTGALLRCARDAVRDVVAEASEALVRIAGRGGTVRLAWELHRLEPAPRLELLASLRARDRALADRLEHLLHDTALMERPDPDALRDDAHLVADPLEVPPWPTPAAPTAPTAREASGRPPTSEGGTTPSSH
jgi:HEAT repeat protein